MSIMIRSAVGEDTEEVARIYVESWNLGFGSLMPEQVLDSDRVERWRTALVQDTTRWWVARQEGRVVGFVGIGPSRDPVDPELGELDTIAVDPPWWRAGIGSALMRTALHALVEDRYREAILWTLAAYPRGQRFYEAMGWEPNGRTRDDGRQVSYRHALRPQRDRD